MALQLVESTTFDTPEKLVTGEELLAMGDIGRTELIDGVVKHYMPTGHPHGFYESTITAALHNYARRERSGRALSGEVGVYIRRNPDTVRAIDAGYISKERLADAKPSGYLDVAPEIAVEILSPSDKWIDVHDKLEDYFEVDVVQVWVVDPRYRRVHVYRSTTDVTVLTEIDLLTASDVLPGFELPVAEIFETW